MQLDFLFQARTPLNDLLQQSRYYVQLNQQVKNLIPSFAQHFRIIRINESGTIIFAVNNSTAAARLKMLLPMHWPTILTLNPNIKSCIIKVIPENTPKPKPKQLTISPHAQDIFQHTAQRMQKHHPNLAAAMQRLSQRHKNL